MIRHIVFFSVKDGHDVDTVREGLERLATIPHADLFEVLPNSKVDPMCDRVDLVVYAEFRDEAALLPSRLIRPMTPPRNTSARCARCVFPPMW